MRLIAASFLMISTAHGAQILDASDGVTVYAKMSKREITRVMATNARIVSVRMSGPALGMDSDSETGQVFLRPLSESKDPVSAFVTMEGGETVTLVLQPADIGADTVVLQLPRKPQERMLGQKPQPFTSAIKRLLAELFADHAKASARAVVDEPLPLWAETEIRTDRRFTSDELVGERFQVLNISTEAMVMVEQEWYRPGVVAVAIADHTLVPGAATTVYVVRRREVND